MTTQQLIGALEDIAPDGIDPNDDIYFPMQVRIKKVEHNTMRCDLCCFREQERICSRLIDSCKNTHYKIIRFL